MAETYETKKINELNEATSAEDSDLMMVGNPSSGQTSKITKENLMKDINESVEKNTEDIKDINSALSELLTTSSFAVNNISVPANDGTQGTLDVSKSGYKAIGVVGDQLGNATPTGNGVAGCGYNSFLSGTNTITYRLSNWKSSDANVQLTIYVLYEAN